MTSPQPSNSHPTDTPPPPPQPPPQQPPQPPPQQPSQPPQQTPPSTNPTPIPNPNPNPNPNPQIPSPQQQFNRPWAHQQPSPPYPRGGIAIGVPAAVSSQPSSFFEARPPMHGMPNMGMVDSQMRPSGVPPPVLNQQRPVQTVSGIRPQVTTNNLPPVSQSFQGHGVLRASTGALYGSSTPSASQSQQAVHQPWLSSAPHGRPPLPSQSFRPQVNPQSVQQRSHIPQQSPQPTLATSQLQQSSPSQQQQFPMSNQSQENLGQQLPSSRVSQASANQQQAARVQALGNQKPPPPAMVQSSMLHSPIDNTGNLELVESCNKILSKRNIQELVYQIDPYEKLDSEVEDVLVDIAEDFVDSITSFGCSLAKHRKSDTLEAKDILLHLERNWNMTLPGFSGDEIKTFKKPVVNDIHKERMAVIKKSLAAGEVKSSAGPAAANIKGHLTKTTPNTVGS